MAMRQNEINRRFDQDHLTDTAAEISLVDAGVLAQDASRGNGVYRPLWESNFRKVLSSLPVHNGNFTFIDLGSGKGKLLLLASHYRFRQIVGVEYAPRLHEIAERNVKIYDAAEIKCREFDLILGDALSFTLPPGPVLCVIFNSFDPETTKRVLANLNTDSNRNEPVYIAYGNIRTVSEMPSRVFEGFPNLQILRRTRNHLILSNSAGKAALA
jgi:SAM-dependent methyltransferase